MKKYKEQFYSEGLATTFYLKPLNFIKKKIKNRKVQKFIICLLKLLYTITMILFASLYIYIKLIKK